MLYHSDYIIVDTSLLGSSDRCFYQSYSYLGETTLPYRTKSLPVATGDLF